ncbi:MAG TPA: hypothetical protein VGO36_07895 [Solirubrobacterales bacterium]|jgi:hypothetical protein|nr:hypothetical protein [Solirubrobacterales bacterium]
MAATVIAAVAALAAIGGLFRAVLEFQAQGRQRRAEYFLAVTERFFSNEQFLAICTLLDERDEGAIAQLPWSLRREFIGFVEEVALLVNSGLISREIAYYMLGYYPLRAVESPAFMHGVNWDSQYWAVFFDFISSMRRLEEFPPPTKAFRL